MSSPYDWPSGRPPLPEARLVKQGTRRHPQSTIREDVRAMVTPSEQTKIALAHLIGLWPLLVVMGLMIGLLWSAGYQQP